MAIAKKVSNSGVKDNSNVLSNANINVVIPTPEIKGRVLQRVEKTGNKSSGDLYINMLNNDSVPTPVMAIHVLNKLVEGYTFIEGESCKPARSHTKGPVFNNEKIHARLHLKPNNEPQATVLWKKAIETGPRGKIMLNETNSTGLINQDLEAIKLMKAIGIPIKNDI